MSIQLRRRAKTTTKLVVVATTALLFATMAPAAAEAGAGTSTGEFSTFQYNDRDLEVPLCLEVTAAVLDLENTGSITATDATGTEVFVGDTTATITMTSDYYFNPEGTFSDNLCTVPAVVRAAITVTSVSATVGTSASCSGVGSYGREGENAQVTTAVTNSSTTNHSSPTTATVGSATCTVNDRAALLPVVLTFTGLQQPCFPDGPPPVDPCSVAPEWVGTYTES